MLCLSAVSVCCGKWFLACCHPMEWSGIGTVNSAGSDPAYYIPCRIGLSVISLGAASGLLVSLRHRFVLWLVGGSGVRSGKGQPGVTNAVQGKDSVCPGLVVTLSGLQWASSPSQQRLSMQSNSGVTVERCWSNCGDICQQKAHWAGLASAHAPVHGQQ